MEHVLAKADGAPTLVRVIRCEWASALDGSGGGSYYSAPFARDTLVLEETEEQTDAQQQESVRQQ